MSAEFVRFLVSGSGITIATYAVYIALLLVVPYLLAYTMAYALGLIASYWLNSFFVFRKPVGTAALPTFILVYALQIGIGGVVLWGLVSGLAVSRQLGMALVILISAPATYLALRFVFARSDR